MLDRTYDVDLAILCPIIILVFMAAAQIGTWVGRRTRHGGEEETDISTLTGASLGLLALLIAFSFSLALARHDARRLLVLEEANAIGSTANFALMLPEAAQRPILDLLRAYTAVRIELGVPYAPGKIERDVARSLDLQAQLWQHAVAVGIAAPQSLSVHRFVNSLNEMNNIHQRRLTGILYHVPPVIMLMLIGIAVVSMAFTGYQIGVAEHQRPVATLIMGTMIALVITMVADLDRPTRGMVTVPLHPLIDTAASLP